MDSRDRHPARVPAAALIALGLASAAGEARADRGIYTFDPGEGGAPWRSVNDGVMGGVSQGASRLSKAGVLEFAGVLSLENRGGFASIWSAPSLHDLGDCDGLVLRVRGDGREYQCNAKTRAGSAAGAYRAPFRTQRGEWRVVRLPFERFVYTLFGQPVPGAQPLDTSRIRGFGFTLADKQAGPFRLEIDWIKGAHAAPAPTSSAGPRAAPVGDIVQTARAAGRFNTLLAAVEAAGLTDSLKAPGPQTVFAPTDDAFAKLPKQALAELLRPESKTKLQALLSRHVVRGRRPLRTRDVKPLSGAPVSVEARGQLRVGGATVLQADVMASNGLIHVIDAVLTADQGAPASAEGARQTIASAIQQGVPLFNAGKAAECASAYEQAARRLLARHGRVLPDKERARLRVVLRRMRTEPDAVRRAWLLRYALDGVARALRD